MFEPDSIEKVKPLLEKQGHTINDPWDILDIFEKKIAEFAGSNMLLELIIVQMECSCV